MRSHDDVVARLRADLTGRVIVPGDADYDRASATFYGGTDRRPSAIARVADADDVAHVVDLARETGVELAVRSGGHNAIALCNSDGGITLDLKDMHRIDIDVAGRTAWAETGMTAIEYSTAAIAHGLATGFGDTGSVGIGGITLGGGIGYLVRKHGMTIDDLLAAEVVTADGRLRQVDATTEPDLFWAIRGGGGNFGVVTRFKLRLHPLGSFTGGMLMLPATAETILKFIELSDAAPDELTTIANVMPAPPLPFVPPECHGTLVIIGMIAYAGPRADGARAIAPFRAIAAPIVDLVKPMPYPEIYPPDDDSYHPLAAGRTLLVDAIDRRSADSIVERLGSSTASLAVTQIRVLGGAMARVPDDATAYAHRTRRVLINVGALYLDPAEGPRHDAWCSDFAERLRRGERGAYVNFFAADGTSRIHEAYPGPTWDRLVAIKRRYDPTNLFRLNQNIPPA